MFDWMKKMSCRSYRARLESYVTFGADRPVADRELDEHLRACPSCRTTLNDGLLASELMRQAYRPVVEPSANFAARVMVSIREEVSRRTRPEAIWRPLELLASRFALGAAAALFVLSLYLAAFAPAPRHVPARGQQTEVDAVIPEPPAQPSNPDEVLISLIERENDI